VRYDAKLVRYKYDYISSDLPEIERRVHFILQDYIEWNISESVEVYIWEFQNSFNSSRSPGFASLEEVKKCIDAYSRRKEITWV
jgi:hypothetical protein